MPQVRIQEILALISATTLKILITLTGPKERKESLTVSEVETGPLPNF
jgi:hypothetical protein